MKHWSFTQATEAGGKACTKGRVTENERGELTLVKHTSWRSGQPECTSVLTEDFVHDEGRNILKCKRCGCQQLSKQDILTVHKVATEENEADELTKHVHGAILERMSDTLGY